MSTVSPSLIGPWHPFLCSFVCFLLLVVRSTKVLQSKLWPMLLQEPEHGQPSSSLRVSPPQCGRRVHIGDLPLWGSSFLSSERKRRLSLDPWDFMVIASNTYIHAFNHLSLCLFTPHTKLSGFSLHLLFIYKPRSLHRELLSCFWPMSLWLNSWNLPTIWSAEDEDEEKKNL